MNSEPAKQSWIELLRSRGEWLAFVALLVALGFLPLLNGPSYEWNLVVGLVAPIWAGVSAASSMERDGSAASAFDALRRGLARGLPFAAGVIVVPCLRGLISGFCEPAIEISFVALGAGVGTILGGGSGAVVGFLLPRRSASTERRAWWRFCGRAALAGVAGPLLAALVGLVDFHQSPAVYLFSDFVGFFAGPLYEVVDFPISRLLTYRVATSARWLAAAAVSAAVIRDATGRLRLLRISAERTAFAVAASGAALVFSLAGPSLGHRTSASSLREGLGGSVSEGPCEVVYERGALPREHAALVARECVGHLRAFAQDWSFSPPEHVTVFLFADERSKKRLVGVGQTYVAKPWRHEVYVQNAGFPHPVLGHELAHVAFATVGRGPFAIAGRWGGFLPDPGRIEGFAVAASPRADTDATLAEWARAMSDLGRLPRLGSLFQLGFFGESGARSYAASGAFVDFIRRTRGSEVALRWYGGEDLAELTGTSFEQLEREWKVDLSRVTPAAEVLADAAVRFSGKAVFEKRCPHAVERDADVVESLCRFDAVGAEKAAEDALRLDASRVDLEVVLPGCALAAGDAANADRRASALLGRSDVPPWSRRDLWVTRADAAWRSGDVEAARRHYTEALGVSGATSGRRPIEVKSWALDQSVEVRDAVRELLTGPEEKGGAGRAAFLLGAWLERAPEDPMALYLVGKNLLSERMPRAALPLLKRAALAQLPIESVKREALRSWLVAACESEQRAEAEQARAALLASGGSVSRVSEATQLLRRHFGGWTETGSK